jgi:hypothetical protein
MAKYTSDTNLIKGAATAYKNYDNVAGMYAGLDKVTKAGKDMMGEVVKGYEAEKKKIEQEDKIAKEKLEKEAKAEKKKQQKQNNDWYEVAGPTYESAGSFMTDVQQKYVIGKLNDLQPRWAEAMENGTAEEKAAVNTEYNSIKQGVEDHKTFRARIADPDFGASAALENSGTKGGNDGRMLEYLTGLVGENYKVDVKKNEAGVEEEYYTVTGKREHDTYDEYFKSMQAQRMDNYIIDEDEWNKAPEMSYTMKEIYEKGIMKNFVPFNEYDALLSEKANPDGFNKEVVVSRVGKIVPTTYNELRAFVADKGFSARRESMADLLRKDSKNLKAEIEAALNNPDKEYTYFGEWSFDDGSGGGKAADGILTDEEFEKFVQAVVDPYHETWQTEEGKVDKEMWTEYTRNIVIERLTNGIKNSSYSEEGGDDDIDNIGKK